MSIQSTLAPQGPEAREIAEISWILIGGGTVIFIIVVVLAALAVFAPRRWMGSKALIIGGGIVFPMLVLSALLVYTLLVAPRLESDRAADLVIDVVAQQWWWRIDYLGPGGEYDFTTANEIRIPVGQVVELRLHSADVLHSFWVPALAGKLDVIPGKNNRLRLSADTPGLFRGQCAEYCGGPHAQMALFVVAEDAPRFEAWRLAQRRPESEQVTPRGREVFLANCASCHTVRGTRANGKLGPDLTHFASRIALGAGILPNRPATVAGWIASGQHLKPGNLMPEFRAFNGEELQALVSYLGSLE